MNQLDRTDPDDPEEWLRALIKAKPGDGTGAEDELSLLRAAVVSHQQEVERQLLQNADSDDHAWQKMRFRLKREDLLTDRKTPLLWATALAASLVLGVVIVQRPTGDAIVALQVEPPVLRGAPPLARVDKPLDQARALAQALKSIDPALQLYWYADVATIDFSVTKERIIEAEERLNALPFQPQVRLNLGRNRVQLRGP